MSTGTGASISQDRCGGIADDSEPRLQMNAFRGVHLKFE